MTTTISTFATAMSLPAGLKTTVLRVTSMVVLSVPSVATGQGYSEGGDSAGKEENEDCMID